MNHGHKRCPIREAYMMRFGIPYTTKHVRLLSASVLEQLSFCRSDKARRLILGISR